MKNTYYKIGLLIVYLILCIIYFRLGKNTPIWDSFFYIKDQGYIIILSLFIIDKSWSTNEKVFYIAGVLYAITLLIFNVCIASKTKLGHDLVVSSYVWSNNFALLILGIFVILALFKKFIK